VTWQVTGRIAWKNALDVRLEYTIIARRKQIAIN
jgi:hypothetical protein